MRNKEVNLLLGGDDVYEFDLAAICRVDGCTKEDLHRRHRIRAQCRNPKCETGGGFVLRMPQKDGSIVCKCGEMMRVISGDKKPVFRDIVGRALSRLEILRGLPLDARLRCPWNDAFTCASDCRCRGTKWVTAQQLVDHYRSMVTLYDHETTAVDDVILSALSRPKHFAELFHDVEESYGKISETKEAGVRKLHRHLASLVERGRMLRLDLGDSLQAYFRPDSRTQDKETIREMLRDRMDVGSWGRACAMA